jgi:hypothetical protein
MLCPYFGTRLFLHVASLGMGIRKFKPILPADDKIVGATGS